MPEPRPDAELQSWLAAIAQGDEAAFAAFYDATSGKVHGLIQHILKDEALAEETTLDTYLQIWREAGSYRASRGSPWAWLILLARSRAIDRLRSHKSNTALLDDEPSESLPDPHQFPPEEQAAADQRQALVRNCLEQLPPVQRQLLALAFFQGLSHSEIAEYSRLPLGTVKTHIRQGLGRLRELLGGREDGLL
ncbi:RNA polymerase sigma-70 factor, ECF subfamily [Methylomagnum ishizawai]|uniref:RNA polymerase sigma-70 factor, ECF subfamily n=1 Tax=Methylomagnum ishizawai TaxID=1760988 RepID=A0A1Y6DAZ5_9GAMM|nr:sigma-70 family RNA polymerase sigma factor [Methylomagnum ishizawai]SMF97314.1 RNA polymerase sigma-70 factor, ECF subfamily [Methylomagnum ishizawai]